MLDDRMKSWASPLLEYMKYQSQVFNLDCSNKSEMPRGELMARPNHPKSSRPLWLMCVVEHPQETLAALNPDGQYFRE
jgi:hypothetical protein